MPPSQLSLDFSVSAAELLDQLEQWTETGWLRRLDLAFARFIADLAPGSAPETLLAAALLAHMEGRGHSCLLLDELLTDSQEILNWPEDAAAAVQTLLGNLPANWLAALASSPVVTLASQEASGSTQTPLILDGSRLYLRRYWQYESDVATAIRSRTGGAITADALAVRHELDQLFPQQDQNPDWQKIAGALALQNRLAIITGGPGTGKTYTVARLLALLFALAPAPEKLRVALAAPTGKAAARLKQSIDSAIVALGRPELAQRIGAARTLHSLLGARPDTRRFGFNAGNLLEVDVLIIDEASMIHLEMMAALLEALPNSAQLILLGDKDQLASVEAGAVLGDFCKDAEIGGYRPETVAAIAASSGETIPAEFCVATGSALAQQIAMLRTSRRFGGPIGQLAIAVNSGDASRAQACLLTAEDNILQWQQHVPPRAVVELALHGRPGAIGGYRHYLDILATGPQGDHAGWVKCILTGFERFRILCALREGDWGVAGLNRAIEQALIDASLIRKNSEWYAGRPVMITRNDYGAGVFNGDIGIALPAADGSKALRVWFLDGGKVRSVLASRLAEVETAYAMTVHKSQGSEFEHTVLVLPAHPNRILTRELVYTGITRARQQFTLVAAQAAVFDQAISQKTRRASGLVSRLG